MSQQLVGCEEERMRVDERLQARLQRFGVADEANQPARRRRLNFVVVKHKLLLVVGEARTRDSKIKARKRLLSSICGASAPLENEFLRQKNFSPFLTRYPTIRRSLTRE
jgi:hypothetical protein